MRRLPIIALAAAATFLAAGTPAPASDSPAAAVTSGSHDLSAAKRKRAKPHRVAHGPVYAAPRFRGAPDPSFGPDGRPYQRPTGWGACVIDDGYGRFSACSNR